MDQYKLLFLAAVWLAVLLVALACGSADQPEPPGDLAIAQPAVRQSESVAVPTVEPVHVEPFEGSTRT